MGWKLDDSSVGRELKTGAGPGRRERSLANDVAYDVSRVLLRKWLIAIIEFTLKALLVFICGWLIWRGAASLFSHAPTQTAQAVAAAASTSAPAAPAPAEETGAVVNVSLVCILAILMLPVATISFMRTMVSKRSNRVNAFTLGIYTAIDFILSYFVVGPKFDTTVKTVAFIGMGIFSLMYNFMVMNYALKLEDGR